MRLVDRMRLAGLVIIGLLATLVGFPAVAHAANQVNAIVPGSLKVTGASQPIEVYNSVKIEANWEIPDQSGRSGDYFTLEVPQVLGLRVGDFDLLGENQTKYGTCSVVGSKVTCTFNAAVEGLNNVGGSVWISGEFNDQVDEEQITINVNGVATQVSVPGGVVWGGHVPTELVKDGWFPRGRTDQVIWRVVVPTNALGDRRSVTVEDTYAVSGTSLTVVEREFEAYLLENTVECWNKNWEPQCRTRLFANDGGNYPGVVLELEDNDDMFTLRMADPLPANKIFVVQYALQADGDINVGSEFSNVAKVSGRALTSKQVKTASGGGSGSGQTVGHINLSKAIRGGFTGNVPEVFEVDYSYTVSGKQRSGTLNVPSNGDVVELLNIPDGTEVTLTERLPANPDISFGDPVYEGDGVTDGGANSASATVSIRGLERRAVKLSNTLDPALKPAVPLAPVVTPGVCPADSDTPSVPTVKVTEVEGVTYGAPEFVPSGDGRSVTVRVAASARPGYRIGDGLGAGWTRNSETSAVFETTVDVPACAKLVKVLRPEVTPGVCPADSDTPTAPTVKVTEAEGVEYSAPEFVASPDGKSVTVRVRASAKAGYRIHPDLGAGWTRNSETSAVFETTVDVPACAKLVKVLRPEVTPGVCPADSDTPTDPKVVPNPVKGVKYAPVQLTQSPDGRSVVVRVEVTAEAGYRIHPDLGAGWTRNSETSAVFETTVDVPACAKLVKPVSPVVTPGVCPADSDTPSVPTVKVTEVEGVTYGAPEFVPSGDGRSVTVRVAASARPGYRIGDGLGAGWTRNSETSAVFETTVDVPACAKSVKVLRPEVTPGVCPADSDVPSDPVVALKPLQGVKYGSPRLTKSSDGRSVVVRVEVTAEVGYRIHPDLPAGWTRNSDTEATFETTVDVPLCGKVVRPISPEVVPGVCSDSGVAGDPSVKVHGTEGVEYGKPVLAPSADGRSVSVSVRASVKDGFRFHSDVPAGWVKNADGSLTFTAKVDVPACAKSVKPVSPEVVPGVCSDSGVAGDPSVKVHGTEGVEYGKPVLAPSADGKKVTLTLSAKAADGFKLDSELPKGWVKNADGSATYTTIIEIPVCAKVVKPATPEVTPVVCAKTTTVPGNPDVKVKQIEGVKYGIPHFTPSRDGKKITITLSAKAADGFRFHSELPSGWVKDADNSATYTTVVEVPGCGKAPSPGGTNERPLPRTGAEAGLLGLVTCVAVGVSAMVIRKRLS